MVGRLRTSLAARLFLAVLAATLPVVALMLALVWFSLGHGFAGYLGSVELSALRPLVVALEAGYGRAGGWSFLPQAPEAFQDWLRQEMAAAHRARTGSNRPEPPPPGWFGGLGAPPPFPPPFPPPGRPPPPRDRLSLNQRTAVFDAQGRLLAGPAAAAENEDRLLVRVGGTVVGWVTLVPVAGLSPNIEARFLADQRFNLGVIALFALGLSALAGWLMARSLLRPIRALVTGTHRLAEGAYDTRLDQTRHDELGELAYAFNHLGQALADTEAMRRRWVADTSHELRTPIAVLRAQIEAMQDGVHQADTRTLGVLHAQVMGLTKLVDDLNTLARSDAAGLALEQLPVAPVAILDDVLEAFSQRLQRAGLTLERRQWPTRPWITGGDSNRLHQLFVNLVENAVRYTDAGGTLAVTVATEAETLILWFDDSAPGVAESERLRLFERFYRVEASRNRERGGSGLGLAICRSIVEAHGGTITATGSPLGGLRIEIALPRQPVPARQERGEP